MGSAKSINVNYFLSITQQCYCPLADPDLQIRGWGLGSDHPDPEIRGVGGGGPKNFAGPFCPYFDLKIREEPSPGFATAATTHLGATLVAVTLAITEALLARVRMSLV